MKVGIMSMQRIVNYGSFLQAYGLKKIIESLGKEVVFVDYKIDSPLCINNLDYRTVKKKKFLNSILAVCVSLSRFLFWLPKSLKRTILENKEYATYLSDYLNVSRKKHYREAVDVLIIGSDEVFNCTQLNPNVGYSLELFGKDSKTSKVCTYAASFGNTTLEKLKKYGKDHELAELLKKMSAISVRDNNSFEIIKRLTDKLPVENLDPVLIYDFTKEIPDFVDLKDYIVVYAYRNRINEKEQEIIKDFARKENKKIVCIGGYQPFADVDVNCTPFEVLDYFRKADYIFTDTFHGSIMSIINHKKFVTFVRDSVGEAYGNAEKLTDLLSRLGLSDRIVSDNSDIETTLKTEINYEAVDGIINREKIKTLNYLDNALKED